MRIRIAKGFNSDIEMPGIEVETAELVIGDDTTALDINNGAVHIPASALEAVTLEQAVLYSELIVNGDRRIPCEIITNPLRPNRR